MSKEIYIDTQALKRAAVNQFAAQQTLKTIQSRRQYRFDGEWSDTNPGKKPDSSRIVLDLDEFRRARSVYCAWTDISPFFGFDPVFPEKIIERLMLQNPVTLFVPWGVSDRPAIVNRECRAMDRLDEVRARFNKQGIANRIVLMPADLYATEVNAKLPLEQVNSYFESVTREAKRRAYDVLPWSEIRRSNNDRYKMLAQDLNPQRIDELVSSPVRAKAMEAARRNSGYSSESEITNAAYVYLRERMCEATIIEETLSPIKLSMAPKNKDNDVDMALPRLYVLPTELVLPWKGNL